MASLEAQALTMKERLAAAFFPVSSPSPSSTSTSSSLSSAPSALGISSSASASASSASSASSAPSVTGSIVIAASFPSTSTSSSTSASSTSILSSSSSSSTSASVALPSSSSSSTSTSISSSSSSSLSVVEPVQLLSVIAQLSEEGLSDEARLLSARRLTALLTDLHSSSSSSSTTSTSSSSTLSSAPSGSASTSTSSPRPSSSSSSSSSSSVLSADRLLRVWSATRELLVRVRVEERDVPLALLVALLRATSRDSDAIDPLRSDVLSALSASTSTSTSGQGHDALRVEVLAQLTRGGKAVSVALAERVFACVAEWLASMTPPSERLLALVHALVKYNASLVPETGLARIVQRVCAVADETRDETLLGHCLRVLDAAVRYARVPAPTRDAFIATLCRAVNVERFSDASWAILANHLQDRAGVALVQRLCAVLDDSSQYSHVPLLRGAVFFLSMALWGSQRVTALDVAPSSVLPSLARVLACRHQIVAYEVALVLRRLVKKRGLTLAVEWHLVGRLLALFRPYVGVSEAQATLVSVLGEVLDVLEEQYLAKAFVGMGIKGTLIAALETFVSVRPEKHAFFLLRVYMDDIAPEHDAWLATLRTMLTTYFVREQRSPIRLRALEVARMLFDRYAHFYAAELAESAVLSFLPTIYHDADSAVRDEGLRFIVHVARSLRESKPFGDLCHILRSAAVDSAVPSETRLAAVAGMSAILSEKFTHSRFDQTLLVLELFRSLAAEEDVAVRRQVLGVLLQLRASPRGYLQLANQASLYVRVGARGKELVGVFDMQGLVDTLASRVRVEPRIELLSALVRGLQQLALNHFALRALSVSALANTLCDLLTSRTLGAQAQLPPDQQRELAHTGYELLTLLMPYVVAEEAQSLSQSQSQPRLTARAVAAFIAGLQFEESPTPYHAIIRCCLCAVSLCHGLCSAVVSAQLPALILRLSEIAKASQRTPAQAAFVTSYYCLLVEEHASMVARLESADIVLALNTLLCFIDRSKISAAKVSQTYRAMSLLFLSLPLQRRASFLDTLVPPIRAQVIAQRCALAEVQLDLLARFAWTGAEPAPMPRLEDASLFFAKSRTQVYVHGAATVLEVSAGRLGWARVKVRRATGTMLWSMQLQNGIRSRDSSAAATLDLQELSALVHAAIPLAQAHSQLTPADTLPPPAFSNWLSGSLDLEPFTFPAESSLDDTEAEAETEAETETETETEAESRDLDPWTTRPAAAVAAPQFDFSPSVDDSSLLLLLRPSPLPPPSSLAESVASELPRVPNPKPEPGPQQVEDVDPREHPLRPTPDSLASSPLSPVAALAALPLNQSPRPLVEQEVQELLPIVKTPVTTTTVMAEEGVSLGAAVMTTPRDLADASSPLPSPSPSPSGSAPPSRHSTPVSTPLRSSSPRLSVDRSPSPSQVQAEGSERALLKKASSHSASTSSLPLRTPAPSKANPTLFKTTPSRTPERFQDFSRYRRAPSVTGTPSSSTGTTGGGSDVLESPSSIHPGFIFLQLQQLPFEQGAVSTRIEHSDALQRSLSLLDRMLSVETHKIGVLYVREGQMSQSDILANTSGSPLYLRFLRLLGSIVRLREIPEGTYSAGLDRSNEFLDGEYSLMWSNEVTQVMFHVPTMMPTLPTDSACTAKKRHVGNDYVHIVFDESGALSYDLDTVTGQFTLAVINVVPLDRSMYRVTVTRKPQVAQFGPLLSVQIVPEAQLGEMVRQTAINGNIACLMHQEEKGLPFLAHSEERLTQLKQIVERFGKAPK